MSGRKPCALHPAQVASAKVLGIKLSDARQEVDAERRMTLQLRSELAAAEVRPRP